MLRLIAFSCVGPIALFFLTSGYGFSRPSTLTYKDCGFGGGMPSAEYLEKAEAFKEKYGEKARVEWIEEENCQGVTLHYHP